MSVCTHKKFIKMSLSEMDAYLDEIYSDEPHRILAEVINVNNSYAEIKALYLLIHGEVAQPFNFFPDKDVSSIKINGKIKIKLSVGKKIICTLRVSQPDAKGQVFTVRADEIEYDFSIVEDFYKRYGLTYDAKYIYELFDGENFSAIIGGDFKEKLISDAVEIISERDAEIAEKYSELEKRTAEVDAAISEKIIELQSLNQKISEATQNLERIRNETTQIKNIYGIVDDEEPAEEKFSDEKIYTAKIFDELISFWQSKLYFYPTQNECDAAFSYRKEVLKSLHWGLEMNMLILLTGSPGTGKTNLVRIFPYCFGWDNAAIIPVQSNWTDKSDLLGYYNPLEKNYISTPFLDALLKFCRKSEKFLDKKFIICLDEMNLAHVEHYFAEFLSVLQSDRAVRLYSDELRRDIYRELKYNAIINGADDTKINFDERRFMNMNLEERKYYLQLCRMANMFFKYPATFQIPYNIKFFGTLNQDATTLDISPKVIDRSFVIRIEKYDAANEVTENDSYDILNFDSDFEERFNIQDDSFKNIMPYLSNRAIQEIYQCSCEGDENEFYDAIIASCILPKIRFDADTDAEKIAALKNLCKDCPYSNEILEKYMTSPDGKEIDYWRA